MIVSMDKYNFVVFRGEKERFLQKLQDLGLVDITTTGWEPDERERELMLSVERHRAAVARLRNVAAAEGFSAEPFPSPEEAWEKYSEAARQEDALKAKIAQYSKEREELEAWGDFDAAKIRELESHDIKLHFFTVYTREYEANAAAWGEQYTLYQVADSGGITYFVAVTPPGESVEINAQEIKPPQATAAQRTSQIGELEKELAELDGVIARAAASADLIERHGDSEAEKLQFSQVIRTGNEEADGHLIVMEGWAPRESTAEVDRVLAETPGVVYLKSKPTPEDDTPTLLKNKKSSRMFEIIGNFYSMPRYGTMDLTRFFGPFYALFFGLCLGDAGYGLIYLILGFVLKARMGKKMGDLANLVIVLGAATTICGFLTDNFFGMKVTNWAPLAGLRGHLLGDHMFVIALGLGLVQLLFAMILKVITYTRRFGIKYALSTIGWILVLYPTLAWALPRMPQFGMQGVEIIPTAVYIPLLVVGAFLMLFMNSPGKNPLVNFGSGLWNLYNDVTGFLSDFLSYIRLFAIGLSGGILASVFNQLAVAMSPDVPVLKYVFMLIILLVGHGLTIFMSSISAFVHPMRLTFVEFFKNAGFEDTQRVFTPLKRNKKE